MARFINSPLSISTATFEYMNGNTLSTVTLDANSFNGGGSGTVYTNGPGISISANTISLESSIYNTVSNLSITNSITSTSTAIPTASAVYNYMPSALSANCVVFEMELETTEGDVAFLNGVNIQSIINALSVHNIVGLYGTLHSIPLMFYLQTCYPTVGGYQITAKCTYSIIVGGTPGFWEEKFALISSVVLSTSTYLNTALSFYRYSVSSASFNL